MTNKYLELKQKQQKEWNEFPMVFAFSNQQFKEAMEKLGLTENDTDKIYSFGGGGYYRKTDSPALHEMIDHHEKEMQEAIDNDLTGDDYIFQMFDYELANHEYCITYDVGDALNALGLTIEEVNASEKLKYALKKARQAQFSE